MHAKMLSPACTDAYKDVHVIYLRLRAYISNAYAHSDTSPETGRRRGLPEYRAKCTSVYVYTTCTVDEATAERGKRFSPIKVCFIYARCLIRARRVRFFPHASSWESEKRNIFPRA